jgi:glutaredoxin 2
VSTLTPLLCRLTILINDSDCSVLIFLLAAIGTIISLYLLNYIKQTAQHQTNSFHTQGYLHRNTKISIFYLESVSYIQKIHNGYRNTIAIEFSTNYATNPIIDPKAHLSINFEKKLFDTKSYNHHSQFINILKSLAQNRKEKLIKSHNSIQLTKQQNRITAFIK